MANPTKGQKQQMMGKQSSYARTQGAGNQSVYGRSQLTADSPSYRGPQTAAAYSSYGSRPAVSPSSGYEKQRAKTRPQRNPQGSGKRQPDRHVPASEHTRQMKRQAANGSQERDNRQYTQRQSEQRRNAVHKNSRPASQPNVKAARRNQAAQSRQSLAAQPQKQAYQREREAQIAREQSAAAHETHTAQGKKNKPRRFYDYSLLFMIIFLTIFGLVMIYSSSSYTAQIKFGSAGYFMVKQAKIAFGGFIIMIIVSKMDYHWYSRFAVFAYVLSYVLMIAVSLVGTEANGKKRWLGVGSLSFQPTELVKIALIVMLATIITIMGKNINQWKAVGIVIGLTIPIAGMVAMNNLSSGIIIMGIAFVMLFIASKKTWPFVMCGVVGISGVAFAGPIAHALTAIKLLKPYQLSRINVWLDPEAYPSTGGFQVLQGLYAIGSGGMMGNGLGESIQKMGFVPEAQNDMIFSIICEELGLVGAMFVIFMFLFMIYRFMLIAGNAPDLFGALLVVGVMAHIAIQVILNIAVVTNTIPNTGITLPFISYGGTSILFLMIEMGMVLSVANQIRLEK